MKLKRCPNLHYYDGDKYDRCPHCAGASEPAPAPKPVIEPAPVEEKPAEAAPVQPEPKSIPVPTAQVKETAPEEKKEMPEPVPEPAPVSAPAEKDGVWVCSCGAENSGRFCAQCGSPRPEPQPEPEPVPVSDNSWTCACGTVNEGRFCAQCGARRPEPQTAEPAAASEPAEEPKEAPVPDTKPETAEPERSLTEQINEAKFIGTAEEAQSRADSRADEGVTQVIFDEIDDDLAIAWLAVVNTSSRGKIFTLSRPKNTVGRSDPEHPVDIDLRNDRGVSRGAQAMIIYDPLNKKFFLQSTGGKTFVYVNKQMLLDHTELKAYDIIKVGETDLVFVPLCSPQFSW